jgi:hypothetical protein
MVNNTLVIGRRIPVGAAITGLVTFFGDYWNVSHPDMALSVAAWGGLAVTLSALAQLAVVNMIGITTPDDPEE